MEQIFQHGRAGTVAVVLAQHQFFAVGRFHLLVIEFQPRQLHAHQSQSHRAEQRKQHRQKHQRMVHMPNPRYFRYLLAQIPQNRQKRHQRQHRFQETHTQSLHNLRKAHRVFLNALRSALDMAHLVPMRLIIVRHRLAPTENVMPPEKFQQHRNHHIHRRQQRKLQQQLQKIAKRHAVGFLQNRLDRVVKRAEPVVNLHVQRHAPPGGQQNHQRAAQRPAPPFFVEKEGLKHKYPYLIDIV